MFKNTTIRARLLLMAGIPLVLILLVAGLGLSVLQSTKINSAEYDRIVLSKDLVADVLPPPENLEGSLLAAYQIADGLAVGDEDQISKSSVAIKRLQRNFNERHLFWERNLEDPQIRKYLLVRAYEPAKRFFAVVENILLPAVARGDVRATQTAVRSLVADYDEHFKAVLVTINLATAEQVQREADVNRAINLRLALLAVAIALLIAGTVALGAFTVRSIVQRIRRLREVATDDLPRAIARVKAATLAGETTPTMAPIAFDTRDELTEAADAFNGVLGSAVSMASEQAALRRTTSAMFVNLGRRNHKLLSRTLSYITELERTERDPETLQNLFRLDHLTTRQRRNAESLLVLAGSAPLRTWSKPVAVADVLRAALSEIESYDRVDIGQMEEIAIKGGAVSDVAHLMAELLENSTNFSPPQTRVRVLGRREGANYAMVIIDEGIGMGPLEISAANQRIATSANTDLDTSKMLGLGVVGRLAARHDISVRLAESPSGGLAVKITLPPATIGDEEVATGVDLTAEESQVLDVRPERPALAPPPDNPEPVVPQPEPISERPGRSAPSYAAPDTFAPDTFTPGTA
ncbi:MAG: sensor histidine kinase, partial [Angustibacter sp.]